MAMAKHYKADQKKMAKHYKADQNTNLSEKPSFLEWMGSQVAIIRIQAVKVVEKENKVGCVPESDFNSSNFEMSK